MKYDRMSNEKASNLDFSYMLDMGKVMYTKVNKKFKFYGFNIQGVFDTEKSFFGF